PDKAPLGPAEHHGRRRLLFQQDVDVQGGDRLVSILLLSFIKAARAAREDFKEGGRLVLKRVRLRVGPANDRGIRIVKAELRWQADADLRVRVKRRAAQPP